jgi:VanZ family protein
LAYTDTFTTHEDPTQDAAQGFTVEIALRPDNAAQRGFRFIAVVHSGKDESQLLIAQWRDTIIAMNGDDYDNRRRSPRLTAPIQKFDTGPFLLVVTSNIDGSALYIDGESVASRTDFTLRPPTDDTPGRLILGNSVYGDNPWRGMLSGFALHSVSLGEETLQRHLESWRRDKDFAGDDYTSADLSYPFSQPGGRVAVDRSANRIELQFPPETTFISPKLFVSGVDTLSRNALPDIVVNLCGFIPFGFFLVALLAAVSPLALLPAVAATTGIGFTLSLWIELTQAWIPSRTSSLLDLALNVAGVGVGAAACAFLVYAKRPDAS